MQKICWYGYICYLALRRSKRGILISVSKTGVYRTEKSKEYQGPGDNQSSDGGADERKAHAHGEVLLSARLVPASPSTSY